MIADSSSALASRNYRLYMCGNFPSVLGVWIQRLALGWHAWQLSESALVVGLVAAAQFVPAVLLTPLVWRRSSIRSVHGQQPSYCTSCSRSSRASSRS